MRAVYSRKYQNILLRIDFLDGLFVFGDNFVGHSAPMEHENQTEKRYETTKDGVNEDCLLSFVDIVSEAGLNQVECIGFWVAIQSIRCIIVVHHNASTDSHEYKHDGHVLEHFEIQVDPHPILLELIVITAHPVFLIPSRIVLIPIGHLVEEILRKRIPRNFILI